MDPPGKKLGSKISDDDDAIVGLDHFLEEESEEEIAASLMEQFGDVEQKRTAAQWRIDNKRPRQEEETDFEEEEYQKKVRATDDKDVKKGGSRDNGSDDDDGSDDDNDIKSTDSKFPEKMFGGRYKCNSCRKYPCEWFDYAAEAHSLFFEVGGTPGGLALPFVRAIQAKHRYTLYGRMHSIRTNMTEVVPAGTGRRFSFPDCVEDQVKLLFPDPKNTYSGFKEKPNRK